MAINPNDRFPTRTTAPDANYPYGGAQNISAPSDGTGTPWIASLINDLFGFQQALLEAAGITPSGDPDTAVASQYLDAINQIVVNNVPASLLLDASNWPDSFLRASEGWSILGSGAQLQIYPSVVGGQPGGAAGIRYFATVGGNAASFQLQADNAPPWFQTASDGGTGGFGNVLISQIAGTPYFRLEPGEMIAYYQPGNEMLTVDTVELKYQHPTGFPILEVNNDKFSYTQSGTSGALTYENGVLSVLDESGIETFSTSEVIGDFLADGSVPMTGALTSTSSISTSNNIRADTFVTDPQTNLGQNLSSYSFVAPNIFITDVGQIRYHSNLATFGGYVQPTDNSVIIRNAGNSLGTIDVTTSGVTLGGGASSQKGFVTLTQNNCVIDGFLTVRNHVSQFVFEDILIADPSGLQAPNKDTGTIEFVLTTSDLPASVGDFLADGSVPMTGDLDLGTNTLVNVTNPVNATDGMNKQFADAAYAPIPAPLTSHIPLVEHYQRDQSSGITQFDLTSLTASTWATIGPTGSGADFEWSGMDDVPLSATVLEISTEIFIATTADTGWLSLDAANTTSQSGVQTKKVSIRYGITSTSIQDISHWTVQLDAANTFNIRATFNAADTSFPLGLMTYTGFFI